MSASGESVPLVHQPSAYRRCVCEHHATHHMTNVVKDFDHPWGGWAMLLGPCSSCPCDRFDPSHIGSRDGAT